MKPRALALRHLSEVVVDASEVEGGAGEHEEVPDGVVQVAVPHEERHAGGVHRAPREDQRNGRVGKLRPRVLRSVAI